MRQQGFALIIALVLMGFLLLLILSLSSLLQVETQSSTVVRAEESARRNALLGLQVAIGELQRVAGEDQRVSARAQIISAAGVENPHWTGVWRSVAPDQVNTLKPVAPENAGYKANEKNRLNPSEVSLISWLVSGNEQVNLGGSPEVGLRYAPTEALDADLHGDVAKNAVILVGASTLRERGASESASLALEDTVVAPKVSLTGTGSDSSGHYAWWVGDENVKARVGVKEMPSVVGAGDTSDMLAFKLPAASSPSAMAGLTFFDRENVLLGRVIDHGTLLLGGASDAEQRSALNGRWHDLSTVSRGLLTDTRWGGFRGDLTLAFENESVFERYFNVTDDTFYFVPVDDFGYSAGFPNWKNLYAYYNLKNQLNGGQVRGQMANPINQSRAVFAEEEGAPWVNNGAQGREGYHNNSPVSALIARLQITVGIHYEEVPAPANPGGVLYSPVLLIKPLAGAYNPYNATLLPPVSAAGELVEQQYRWAFLPLFTLKVYDEHGNPKSVNGLNSVSFRLREVLSDASVTTPARDLIMNLPRVEIEPGETRLYALWKDINRSQFIADGQVLELETAADNTELYDPMAGFMMLPLESAFAASNNGATASGTPSDTRFGLTPDEKAYLLVKDTDRIELTIDANSPGAVWYNYSTNPAGVRASNYHVQFFYDVANPSVVSGANPTTNISFYVLDALGTPGSAGAQANLFTWGFWLRSAADTFAASRLLVDHNMRAIAAPQTWDRMNDNYYMSSVFTGEFDGGQTHGYLPDPLPSILGDMEPGGRFIGFWGGDRSASGGNDRVVLFDVPRSQLLSLGAFQHANIGRYSFDPTYAVGNSFVPARIRDLQNVYDSNGYRANGDIWDLSYVLNQQLWDSYYFSGIATALSDANMDALLNGRARLPNHRLSLAPGSVALTAADLTDGAPDKDTFYKAGSHLLLEGAFNINSTSEEAWTAVLSSTADLKIPNYTLRGAQAGSASGYSDQEEVTFSRLQHPVGEESGGGSGSAFWSGYRTLTTAEVSKLANEIVRLIRERGKPFGSLGDFVNRPLQSTSEKGRPGLLQEAIDNVGLNNDAPGHTLAGVALPAAITHNQINGSSSGAAFPGYLTQADILQALGPVLTARSDTFVIRSYGDSVATGSTVAEAQAWCEAVVQRMPDEVLDGGDVLSRSANRKFRIISFRWLGKDEI